MKIRDVSLDLIDQGDQLIRDNPEDDSIGELAESMAKIGLLQPIGVTESEGDRYQLLWGDRRCRAARRLNWAKITAHVYPQGEAPIKATALIENLQRSNMTFEEEVQAVIHMNEVDGLSVERIASALSKSRSWVQNRLMVPSLPEHLRTPLLAGDLPISHLEIIAKVPDDGAQRYLVAQCVVNKWNKSALRTIAECYMMPGTNADPHPTNVPGIAPSPHSTQFTYECEMCHGKGTLDEFTLVRIHKDGNGCRTIADRPSDESSTINGMDSAEHEHTRPVPATHD